MRRERDPTAHAEMLAIRAACAAIGNERLPEATLYVTLEPCPMCAGAIAQARLARLYYGAADIKGGAVDNVWHCLTSQAVITSPKSMVDCKRPPAHNYCRRFLHNEEKAESKRVIALFFCLCFCFTAYIR